MFAFSHSKNELNNLVNEENIQHPCSTKQMSQLVLCGMDKNETIYHYRLSYIRENLENLDRFPHLNRFTESGWELT